MPAQNHDFTKTEIKAGIFVFVSLTLMALLIGAVMRVRPPMESKTFHAFFSDTGGLNDAADVRFGGFKVGRVQRISPDEHRRSMIRVAFEVAPDTPVNADSVAFVTQTTLTSDKHLAISTGTDDAPLLESGAELSTSVGGLFGPIEELGQSAIALLDDLKILLGVTDEQGKPVLTTEEQNTISELFGGLDGLIADLRLLMGVVDAEGELAASEEERRTVVDILASADEALTGGGALVEDLRGAVEDLRPQLDDLMTTANEAGESAGALVDDLKSFLDDNREELDGTIEGANEALDNLNDLIVELNSLTGTLESTLDRSAPDLEDLLLDLGVTMRNLKELTRTLTEQPQSIIRGVAPTGRQ